MSRKMKFFVFGVGFFLLFILFSYIVHEDVLTQFDFNTTVRLQDRISRSWDNEFSLLSDIGKFEVSTIVLAIILGFLAFRKKYLAAITGFVLYVGFHVIELFGKYFVDHPPPPQFMLRTEQIINFPQFHVRSEYSYPSGHSGRTIFLSVLIILLIWQSRRVPQWLKFVIIGGVLIYDITMLISRVTLGEHWSTDVIGGSILGLAFGLVTASFLVRKGEHHSGEHHKHSLFPKYKIEIKKME